MAVEILWHHYTKGKDSHRQLTMEKVSPSYISNKLTNIFTFTDNEVI